MTFTPGINLCQFALGNKSALSRLGFDQQIPRDGRHNSGYSKEKKTHRQPQVTAIHTASGGTIIGANMVAAM